MQNFPNNSILFLVPHENNVPLSKCKLFIDSHGIKQARKKLFGRNKRGGVRILHQVRTQ